MITLYHGLLVAAALVIETPRSGRRMVGGSRGPRRLEVTPVWMITSSRTMVAATVSLDDDRVRQGAEHGRWTGPGQVVGRSGGRRADQVGTCGEMLLVAALDWLPFVQEVPHGSGQWAR